MKKTLIIQPEDPTTNFLKVIYEGRGFTQVHSNFEGTRWNLVFRQGFLRCPRTFRLPHWHVYFRNCRSSSDGHFCHRRWNSSIQQPLCAVCQKEPFSPRLPSPCFPQLLQTSNSRIQVQRRSIAFQKPWRPHRTLWYARFQWNFDKSHDDQQSNQSIFQLNQSWKSICPWFQK